MEDFLDAAEIRHFRAQVQRHAMRTDHEGHHNMI